jgi:ABC-type xylose transport system substrate-binding protein
MDVVTINGTQYYSIEKLMLLLGVTSKKTIYNMVKDGRVKKKKLFNKGFFKVKE